jgi:aspartyl-tRNA(Asn)/glutamyl-tRNA(Gln) amidotransferase subunit B
MEEGNFRCDANVSLRRAGSSELGSKVEVKNMNSFRAVEHALKFEVERQARELEAGQRIVQETRGWVEGEERTVSQRSKEEASDYRYFPDPDLPPVTLTPDDVAAIRARLPELPDARRRRFISEYGLSEYEANLLTESRVRADYYERAVAPAREGDGAAFLREAKQVSNWMLGDFARLLHASGADIGDAKVAPEELYAMIVAVRDGTITGAAAKAVFEQMFANGHGAGEVIKELGLEAIGGADEISAIVAAVIERHPKAVADFHAGKQEAVKFLVGQAMREAKGRADPNTLSEQITQQLTRN